MAEIHGHMTMADGTSVALSKDEAAAIWKSIEADRASRAEALPTARDALEALIQAETRLRELGWARGGGFRVKRGDDCAVAQQGSTGMWRGSLDAEGGYVHFGDSVVSPRNVWLKPLPDLTPDEVAHMAKCDQREADAYNAMIERLSPSPSR